jgi:hypothetical protein
LGLETEVEPTLPPHVRMPETQNAFSQIALILWGLVLLLTPFYVFPSGSPQPADFVLAVLIGGSLLLWGWQSYPNIIAATTWALSFFLLTIVVNLTFIVVRQDLTYLPAVLFMAFNAMTFVFALGVYAAQPLTFTKVTGNCVAGSLLLQAFLSLALGGVSRGRAHLFFNNPNQLGYFALTMATLLLVCGRRVKLLRGSLSAGLGCGLYLAALSLSKAALLGYALLGMIEWLRLTNRAKTRWAIAVTCVATAIALSGVMDRWLILSNVSARLQSVGVSSDDNLAARGYGRIVNFPQYLAFGSGEGEPSRWVLGQAKELHSSWGTILFAYGLLGLSLFLGFLASTAQTVGFRKFVYLIPLFFYGLTHQGLREPLFWVTLAMVLLGAQTVGSADSQRSPVSSRA